MKLKLVIAYVGTPFSGWQIQPNGRTVQEELEKALFTIFQQDVKVTGAGRTDAGVHAHGQVAHIIVESIPPALQTRLNSLLPEEISVLEITPVPDTFHARFSAKEKIYTYRVTTAPVQSPFDLPYSLHYTFPLSFEAIEQTIPLLLGKHDFSTFANESHLLPDHKDRIKYLYAITLTHDATGFSLTFRGDGFLYKMVRNLTGLLLETGRGKLAPLDAKQLLEEKNRTLAPAAAPAHGLTLTAVRYE